MTEQLAEDSQQVIDDLQRRLDESIAQQAATADVLRVISRSNFDLQTVLETLITSAVKLCGANRGSIFLREGDVFPLKAASSTTPEFLQYWAANPPKAGRGSATSRVIASGKVEVIADVLTDPEMQMPAGSLNRIRGTLGVPLLRDNKVEGVMVLTRPEPGAFTRSQIDLVQTFADQAMIAIENARLFDEVQAKSADLHEALQHQTAASEVLQVISRSPGELDPVFQTILSSASGICEAQFGLLVLYENGGFRCTSTFNLPPAFAETFLRNPVIYPPPIDPLGRLIETRQLVHVIDVKQEPAYLTGFPPIIELVELGGARTLLLVPMLKESELIGVIAIFRQTVHAFTEKQIELVTSFGSQAVIAIENARLLNELRERTDDLGESLQHQTATSEVLKVISRSPGQLDPVFQTILASATDICTAQFGNLFVLQEDGGFHCASTINLPRAFAETFLRQSVIYPPPIDPLGRVIATRQPVHVIDAMQEPAYVTGFRPFVDVVELGGAKTILLVPMLKEDALVGVIAIFRQTLHPFSDKQIELVTSFANQAVIAIQNTRLFNETREALEQQTAIAEVLGVINASPGNLTPVFEAMVEKARRLCGADSGHLALPAGDDFRTAVVSAMSPELEGLIRAVSYAPGRGTAIGRSLLERRAVQIADIAGDSEHAARDTGHKGLIRTILGAPLLREGEPIGAFGLSRARVEPFTQRQIDLVETFASQAVIAIENARLLDELRQRTSDLSESLQQQTATADVLKVISRSAFDLQTVLDTLVVSAARLCDADRACIFQKKGEVYRWVSNFGFSAELIAYADEHPFTAGTHSTTSRVALEGKPIHNPDVLADPNYRASEYQRLGNYRTMLGIPLLREGAPIGVFILTREKVRPFTDRQIELVTGFADQAVIAIENVRLFEQVQARTRELAQSLDDLRTAQDRLVQTEKLASLGQLTAGIAHEIKNPLNFVNNFSALSADLIDELNDLLGSAAVDAKVRTEIDELTQMLKGNLEKVVQHGRRADSIVKNMLLHSREGSGERRSADINAIVEESLNLAYHGARAEQSGFNITLERNLDPSAGIVDLYPQEITRVLLNLISNGFYAAHKRKEAGDGGFEPSLTAITKNLGNNVEIRIRDNGTGIPAEVKEKMFNPFFTTKPAGEGTGLGLSMSHDIVVKQHGGKIEVDTEPGQFTEFTITLPRAAARGQAGG